MWVACSMPVHTLCLYIACARQKYNEVLKEKGMPELKGMISCKVPDILAKILRLLRLTPLISSVVLHAERLWRSSWVLSKMLT